MKDIIIGIATESSWEIDSGYLAEMLNGVQEAADELGVSLIRITCGFLAYSPTDPYEKQRNILISNINSKYLDGLIVSATTGQFLDNYNRKMLHPLLHKVPSVGIGPIPILPSVVIDNKKAISEAMDHLILHHKYKRIAFIRGPQYSIEAADRYSAYMQSLADHGIPFRPELVAQGSFFVPSGIEAVKELLDDRRVAIDAIVAANDEMALGAIDELNRRKITVPYDIAVLGFDDIYQAKHIVPPLTTIHQPLKEMGKTAVRMLIEKINGGTVENDAVMHAQLTIRQSCGCDNVMLKDFAGQELLPEASDMPSITEKFGPGIIEELKGVCCFPHRKGNSWAEDFFGAFALGMDAENGDRFNERIDRQIRKLIASEADIYTLNKATAVLHSRLVPRLKDSNERTRLEALLHKTQGLISLQSQNAFSLNTFRQNREVIVLHTIANALISTFDIPRLMDLLAEMLPLLGITGCYLSLYEHPEEWEFPDPPPEWCRLILAFNKDERIEIQKGGIRFKTETLLPPEILAKAKKETLTAESLYFRSRQMGYIIFEGGSHRRLIYEVLRAKVSSALEGALILTSHRESKTELRLHKDHLEDLVLLRTRELESANAALKARIEELLRAQL